MSLLSLLEIAVVAGGGRGGVIIRFRRRHVAIAFFLLSGDDWIRNNYSGIAYTIRLWTEMNFDTFGIFFTKYFICK